MHMQAHAFVYLDEPARRQALRTIQQMHPGPGRWDLEEVEHAAAAMATALAAAVGQPDPARPRVEVTVWDARRFSLAGTWHPHTATTLPWRPGLEAVTLGWHRRVHVHTARPDHPARTAMRTAVHAAIAAAWKATREQVAVALALEWIATCEPRFTRTGHLTHPGGR